MKTFSSKQHIWISAVAGITAVLGATTANAAFQNVLDNTFDLPGIPLLTGTTGLAGTVIASQEVAFSGTLPTLNPYTGVLRSMVVNTGAGYDFYYQVINNSTSGILGEEAQNRANDIFRMVIPGYALTDPLNPVDATYRTDGLAGLTLDALSTTWVPTQISNNAGGGQVFSADRDPNLDTADFFGGGAGFYFDSTQLLNTNSNPLGAEFGATTAPDNIEAGERSNWLVLRTNYSIFNVVDSALISAGGGSGLASTFAPIPEPSTVLFGLAMFGVCAAGRLRKSRAVR